MRSALLSTLELTPEGKPRAFEQLGGRSLIAWQVDMAIELGCSRIICLAERDSGPIQDLRAAVEREGLQFQLISGPLALVGLLSADQELAVIADGLVVDRERLSLVMGERRGVVALPAEEGIAAGFERIDAEYAWGGVLVARARIAEQLAEMPADSDTISLLLRLALQSGVSLVRVSADALESGEWLLVRDRSELTKREEILLDRSLESAAWNAPGTALSLRAARALAPDAFRRGPVVASTIGGMGLTGAIGVAQIATPFAALLIFAASVLAVNLGLALANLKARLHGIGRVSRRRGILGYVVDMAFVAVLALPIDAQALPQRIFLALVFVGLLRLGESLASERWQASWRDRILIVLLLLPAAWFGVLDQALGGLCVAILATCLFSSRKLKITQV